MNTFEDNLSRLEVIAFADGSIPLPRDLGMWACSRLRDLRTVRDAREVLPAAISKALRDQRILAANDVIADGSAWSRANELFEESSRMMRTWRSNEDREMYAGSVRGELHAACGWDALPRTPRTFFRIVTKQP